MNLQRAALVVSLACLPRLAEAQGPKVDPALLKVTNEYIAGVAAKDAAKLGSLYAEDAILHPANEPPVRGRAAIQAWMQKMFEHGASSLAVSPVEATISGNIGYEVDNYTLTIKPPNGAPIVSKGKSIVVFKLIGGKWLMAHDIFNSDLPPPPPAKK